MTLEDVDPALWTRMLAVGTWPAGARVTDRYGALWVTIAGGSPGTWVPLDSLSDGTQSGTSGPAAADMPRGNFADSFTLTSIPTDTWTNPPWADNNNAGLLDLTDPTQPVLIRGGVIAVCIEWKFTTSAETTGKTAYVELDLDANGADWNVAGNFSLDPLIDPGGFQVQCPLSVTGYVPAGGVISVAVQHNVGSAKDGYLAQASIHYLVLDPAP